MKLTPGIIDTLRKQGLNQSEIARRYGVSRQAVSKMKRANPDHYQTARDKSRPLHPWRVPAEQQNDYRSHRLRDHVEYVIAGGNIARYKLEELAYFYRKLIRDNLVVEYTRVDGYEYRARKPADGNLIIRINAEAEVPDPTLWELPSELPNVDTARP